MDKEKKALEAASILNSELFRDVFEELDAKYVKMWRACGESAKREECWHLQRALAEVKGTLMEKLKCAAVSTTGRNNSQIRAAYKAAKEKS